MSIVRKVLAMLRPFEITLFAVGKRSKGGDAILVRWAPLDGKEQVILIDGGYASDFPLISGYLPKHIDHVVCSHLDNDHLAGLIELMKDRSRTVGTLWLTSHASLLNGSAVMLAPHSTSRPLIVEAAKSQTRVFVLQESVRQGCELVRLANSRPIPVRIVPHGKSIGPLKVLSPTPELKRALHSDNDQDIIALANRISISGSDTSRNAAGALLEAAVSISNELSTVLWTDFQGAFPGGFLFTSDAGPKALDTALETAGRQRIDLANLGGYQLPHHGSIANFPSEYRDRIKAPLIFVSAPPTSDVHPSRALITNLIRGGAKVFRTEGSTLRLRNEKLDVKPLGVALEFDQHGVFVYRIRHA